MYIYSVLIYTIAHLEIYLVDILLRMYVVIVIADHTTSFLNKKHCRDNILIVTHTQIKLLYGLSQSDCPNYGQFL